MNARRGIARRSQIAAAVQRGGESECFGLLDVEADMKRGDGRPGAGPSSPKLVLARTIRWREPVGVSDDTCDADALADALSGQSPTRHRPPLNTESPAVATDFGCWWWVVSVPPRATPVAEELADTERVCVT